VTGAYFKVGPTIPVSPGGTKQNYKKQKKRQREEELPVSRPKLETKSSGIPSRSANHYITSFILNSMKVFSLNAL
jgi:hypothetical protein